MVLYYCSNTNTIVIYLNVTYYRQILWCYHYGTYDVWGSDLYYLWWSMNSATGALCSGRAYIWCSIMWEILTYSFHISNLLTFSLYALVKYQCTIKLGLILDKLFYNIHNLGELYTSVSWILSSRSSVYCSALQDCDFC